jgi:CHAT domain-containing protein
MANEKTPKNPIYFCCENCQFNTSNKKDYTRHILTAKHKRLTNTNENTLFTQIYSCNCGKTYNHMSSLCKHKKTCIVENIIVEPVVSEPFVLNNEFENPENLIKYLMKENAEFKSLLMEQNKQLIDQNKQMIEIAKKTGNNITNNNSFNLNMYLNETCKDALNIMDFVNQLKIGIKDLEETGRLGFADGISKIFINGLKQLDVSNRPVHCSDSKREILYIKNNNEWNKEDDERKVLTSAIKHVVNKNIKQIPEWTKVNPDYNDYHSKQNDKYLQIVMESMSGSSQEEANKNYNKIIKNIAKETVIEKDKCLVSLG